MVCRKQNKHGGLSSMRRIKYWAASVLNARSYLYAAWLWSCFYGQSKSGFGNRLLDYSCSVIRITRIVSGTQEYFYYFKLINSH